MALSPEERATRKRDRMLAKAAEYQTSTYLRKYVAPQFQIMARAESGADPRRYVTAVVKNEIRQVERSVGQCVCVTCGKLDKWNSGIEGMHTGHFLASRRNSILLEEDNVAPQCSHCNYYQSGAPQSFRKWMLAVRGEEVVKRLERLKTESRSFTRYELVDLRMSYMDRIKQAKGRMDE